MHEDQNIQPSQEDGKTESPEEVNDELQIVNHETSNVNEETQPNINNEPLTNMEVHHHPDLHHKKKI